MIDRFLASIDLIQSTESLEQTNSGELTTRPFWGFTHSLAPLDEVVRTGHPQAIASKELFENGSYIVGKTNKSAI